MLKLKSLLAIALFSLCSQAYAMNDFWTGTVSLEGDALILTRCSIVPHKFFLVDEEGDNEALIEQLPPEVKDESRKVSVTVVGDVTGNKKTNGEYTITVSELQNIKLSSCHLSDMFG